MKKTMSATIHRTLVTLALAVASVSGCSSDSSDSSPARCGEGTVEVNGTCVPGGQCGTGTHSENGTCVPDGTGGTSGSSGSGGNGGSAGSAGSAGSSGTAGSAGTAGSGGTAGTAGASGTGGVAGAGGTAGSAGTSADDPCPTTAAVINCSDSCGPMHSTCANNHCIPFNQLVNNNTALAWENTFPNAPPLTFRTPSHPGNDPRCADGCGGTTSTVVFGMSIGWVFASNYIDGVGFEYGVLAKTHAPWRVLWGDPYSYYCMTGVSGDVASTCAANQDGSGSGVLYVMTEDPNAPSVNVTIEHVLNPVSCP